MPVKGMVLFAVFAFFLTCISDNAVWAGAELSKEKIIAIAESKASELGYDLNSMSITYDEDNAMFKKHLRPEGVSVYHKETQAWIPEESRNPETAYPKLKGRDYQAVYFGPEKIRKGGDLWVFVDRRTGEVIDSVSGQ